LLGVILNTFPSLLIGCSGVTRGLILKSALLFERQQQQINDEVEVKLDFNTVWKASRRSPQVTW
jgi:hypothetical protein